MAQTVDGILVLYRDPHEPSARTILEHVEAFHAHSRFRVWNYDTSTGFPAGLAHFRFAAVVLHYSLFAPQRYHLDEFFRRYLDQTDSYKVAFFQDEHHYCRDRFDFLDRHRIDCVYTLLEPAYWPRVYGKHTRVPKLVYGIPGYVSDDLVRLSHRIVKPDEGRTTDIGYRGRTLLPYMGRASQEKADVGVRFLERARDSGLSLDIAVDEDSRIYDEAWFEFLANCRGVLGTEAGVSIFDLDDVVRTEYERLVAEHPEIGFEELSERLLGKWEDNIYYRTVSPRHFEAAALRVCQILYEGRYSGILEPFVHYIPLKKDFSNFDDVLRRFRDPEVRRRLTENAHRDLIASERYSYRQFVASFDEELLAAGLRPKEVDERVAVRIAAALARGAKHRRLVDRLDAVARAPALRFVLKPLVEAGREWYVKWNARRFERRVLAGGRETRRTT